MAIGNERLKAHIHYRTCLSNDTKPTTSNDGDEIYEVDTGDTYIWHKTAWVRKITQNSFPLLGVATGGSGTTLVDASKDFDANLYINKTIRITIGGIDYYRLITNVVGDTITFATLGGVIQVVAGTQYIIY